MTTVQHPPVEKVIKAPAIDSFAAAEAATFAAYAAATHAAARALVVIRK